MSSGSMAVYPRACGERLFIFRGQGLYGGLSPRLRGTEYSGIYRGDGIRFIPAPAGNGQPRPAALSFLSVYPRACGERMRRTANGTPSAGLSPRLRGTGVNRELYAGCQAVYPRACGERMIWKFVSMVLAGLSPRLRGTEIGQQQGRVCRRFIPAPAGNGAVPLNPERPVRVYPRACGERAWDNTGTTNNDGLSPRLRGTVQSALTSDAPPRFIPAPAGNGPCKQVVEGSSPVYPRACGERVYGDLPHPSDRGLSPRLRGTGSCRWSQRSGFAVYPRACGERVQLVRHATHALVYPRACGERS